MPKSRNKGSIFYAYVLFDWLGVPRYVGKGHGNRDLSHENRSSVNWLKDQFIEQTWLMLDEIPKVKIQENLTESEAFNIEILLIKTIGRIDRGTGPLTNMTDGGEGPSGRSRSREHQEKLNALLSGKPRTEEVKAKIRAKLLGHDVSEETRNKIRAGNKGKTHTEETKEIIRIKQTLHMTDPENRKRRSVALKGRSILEETKIKIGNAHRGKTISEEQRELLRKANLGRKDSEETCKKRGAAISTRLKDPVVRARYAEASRGRIVTEETRLKISEGNKLAAKRKKEAKKTQE
jgi:hypothetical protein